MAKTTGTKKTRYAEKLIERKRLSGSKGYNTINKGQVKKLPIPLPMFQDA
ncbi:MAG: hypothetical protein M0R03_08615 [Novosphingobium sp.]|nr:hypothetical protein [Novosphingobium sp.]